MITGLLSFNFVRASLGKYNTNFAPSGLAKETFFFRFMFMVQPFQKCLIASIKMMKLDVNSERVQTLSGLLCDCFCR